MSLSFAQLLDPGFSPSQPISPWPENAPALRYAVKLRRASRHAFLFQLELYGRLFSLAIDDLKRCLSSAVPAVRVQDDDLRHLLSERAAPAGSAASASSLVWDHGMYRTDLGTPEDVMRQLLEGRLAIHLQGIRLNGQFIFSGRGEHWQVQRLSGAAVPANDRSVLTGRSLDEIESPSQPKASPLRLWLEWEHFYTEQTLMPEIAIHQKTVVDLNFAAATRGISVGMPLQHVLPLVPDCKVTPFTAHPERQHAWLDHVLAYSNTIQPFESHSAAVDLSAHPDAADIAGKLVKKLSGKPFGRLCYGAGPSNWIAQLATQLKNPFGFVWDTAQHLAPLPVDYLLAIPVQDRERLSNLGFKSIGDVAEAAPDRLRQQFGEAAHAMVAAAQGRTVDRVLPLYPPQSLCETLTFPAPVNDSLNLHEAAAALARRLAKAVSGRQAGLVVLTAELEEGGECTIKRPYKRPVHRVDQIQASLVYLATELQKSCPDIVRLTARLDQVEPIKSAQQDLFIAMSRNELQTTLTSLKTSLGDKSVLLASQMEIPRREQVLKVWRNATGWN